MQIVREEEEEWFQVKVGLLHGCVTSLWLCNLFMDDVEKVEYKDLRERSRYASLLAGTGHMR